MYVCMYIDMLLVAREGLSWISKSMEKSVDEISGFDLGGKALMCWSSETVEGLHITGINQ